MPKSFYNNGIGVKDNERQSTNEYESISLLRKRDNLMGVRNTYVIMGKVNGMNVCLSQREVHLFHFIRTTIFEPRLSVLKNIASDVLKMFLFVLCFSGSI